MLGQIRRIKVSIRQLFFSISNHKASFLFYQESYHSLECYFNFKLFFVIFFALIYSKAMNCRQIWHNKGFCERSCQMRSIGLRTIVSSVWKNVNYAALQVFERIKKIFIHKKILYLSFGRRAEKNNQDGQRRSLGNSSPFILPPSSSLMRLKRDYNDTSNIYCHCVSILSKAFRLFCHL